MWFNWFLPPRQQNKSADDLLSSSWCRPTWLEGLCRVCRQLNACTWTESWTHEFCIFSKWQHQDHQHYQIAGWNTNHSEISDFRAQLQLSEWLLNTVPVSGRALGKGSLTRVEIRFSCIQVGLGRERENSSHLPCTAVWGSPCLLQSMF